MWRDVFLNNRDAVLEVLGRFNEDLSLLQRAIRDGNGQLLFDLFTRTRAIRRSIIDVGQDTRRAQFRTRPTKAEISRCSVEEKQQRLETRLQLGSRCLGGQCAGLDVDGPRDDFAMQMPPGHDRVHPAGLAGQ